MYQVTMKLCTKLITLLNIVIHTLVLSASPASNEDELPEHTSREGIVKLAMMNYL